MSFLIYLFYTIVSIIVYINLVLTHDLNINQTTYIQFFIDTLLIFHRIYFFKLCFAKFIFVRIF